MSCLRRRLVLKSLVSVFPALLVGLGGVPVQATGAIHRDQRVLERGWQIFLSRSSVRMPTGIAIDLRGAKHATQWGYVADAGTGRIVKFGTGGRVLRGWRYAAPGHPAVLTVGGAGNLFVADRADGTIAKFSPDGRRLAFWTPKYLIPLNLPPRIDPRGIAVDREGKIYVADNSAHRIMQFSPGGTLLQSWDTYKGFTAEYSVPHVNSGPLGTPSGVVYDPPDHLFISTVCVTDPACPISRYTSVPSYGHDVLLVLATRGTFAGYVGNFWFGLGYTATGTPGEAPGKESEAFVHIDAMAGDGKGRVLVAGTLWPRGAQYSLGVLSYSDLGYQTAPWRLPSQNPIAGVAVDGRGSVYVAQGNVLLKRSPAAPRY